jgi:hypothetical protein
LLLYSSYLPLGVPNWTVIHINRTASIIGAYGGGDYLGKERDGNASV